MGRLNSWRRRCSWSGYSRLVPWPRKAASDRAGLLHRPTEIDSSWTPEIYEAVLLK